VFDIILLIVWILSFIFILKIGHNFKKGPKEDKIQIVIKDDLSKLEHMTVVCNGVKIFSSEIERKND
jgi:hypothetical protein